MQEQRRRQRTGRRGEGSEGTQGSKARQIRIDLHGIVSKCTDKTPRRVERWLYHEILARTERKQ